MPPAPFARISIRLYRALLRLYPIAFRDVYGGLMAQTFGDQCREARNRGRTAWISLWGRTLYDVALTVPHEHLAIRKVRQMEITSFRNQPDRLTSALFLIPGLILSLYYVLTIHNGEATGYLWAAGIGAVGFTLGFLKMFRPLQIWGQLALGVILSAACLTACMIGSPMMNLGIPALRTPTWQTIRLVATFTISPVVIILLARVVKCARWQYGITAAIMLASGVLIALLDVGPNEHFSWNVSWAWASSASILAIAVLSHWLSRRSGMLALLTTLVALGTLNAALLTLYDVAQGRTPYGQITLLLAYGVPLVFCPIWLLFAPTWRSKKRGVLLSWAGMLLGMSVGLPLLDALMKPHFFRWVNPVTLVRGLITLLPLLLGLWLAFTLYEQQELPPETALDQPLDDSPTVPAIG